MSKAAAVATGRGDAIGTRGGGGGGGAGAGGASSSHPARGVAKATKDTKDAKDTRKHAESLEGIGRPLGRAPRVRSVAVTSTNHAWCHNLRRAAFSLALVALVTIGLPAPAAAGPWVPDPGEGYVKVWLKFFHGLAYRSGDGNSYDYGPYNELFLATYGEVGVAENLSLYWQSDILRTFYLHDPSSGETGVHAAPGDPAIGFRYQFLSGGRFVMAAEAWGRIPLANGEAVQPVLSTAPGNPQIGELRIGAGAFDLGAGMSAGYGWDHFYTSVFGSYVLRSQDYDHVIQWTAEGGYGGASGFSIRGRITGYHSLGNGTAPYHDSPSGLGNGTNYVGFAIETDWELWPANWLGVSFEGGLFAVSRQSGGPVISLYWAKRF